MAIIVSDQHMVAKVPALVGVCIATCRYENLTLAQIIDHTIFMIADTALKGKKPRSPDKFGAVSDIEKANDGREIYLFLSSGTELVLEQGARTSYQMQRALDLISCSKVGTGKAGPIKCVVFLQPAVHSISKTTNDSSGKVQLANINFKMSNAARVV